MENIIDLVTIENKIKNNSISILYFTGLDCGACEAIKFKVNKIIETYNIFGMELSGEEHLDIAAHFNVFSLPLLILYVEGKETMRFGRNIDLLDFEKIINRYSELLK